jgi:hypothetical protein
MSNITLIFNFIKKHFNFIKIIITFTEIKLNEVTHYLSELRSHTSGKSDEMP